MEEKQRVEREKEEAAQREYEQSGDIGEMMAMLRESKQTRHVDDTTNLSIEDQERQKMAEEIFISYEKSKS